MYICVPACMYVCHYMHAYCHGDQKIDSPGSVVTDRCEPPCGCEDLNPGLLKE